MKTTWKLREPLASPLESFFDSPQLSVQIINFVRVIFSQCIIFLRTRDIWLGLIEAYKSLATDWLSELADIHLYVHV